MTLNYCGGISSMPKAQSVDIRAGFGGVILITRGFGGSTEIPLKDVTKVSTKTDEQISKDVTLTRLLLLGIFAFGVKKKTKEVTNYLVIEYLESGIECAAIFSGDKVPKAYAEITNARQNMLANSRAKPTAISESEYSQASKLEKFYQLMQQGVITQEEFQAKKKNILGL